MNTTKEVAASDGDDGSPSWFSTVTQVRIARPTHQLERVVAFYRDDLGLVEITRFADHDGYSGVILGLPNRRYHLEFTQHEAGSPCPAPSRDNLLVLYLPDRNALQMLRERLEQRGHPTVPPENPYWLDKSVTFADPDGWRVVLCSEAGV